jgi:hypothetical protein
MIAELSASIKNGLDHRDQRFYYGLTRLYLGVCFTHVRQIKSLTYNWRQLAQTNLRQDSSKPAFLVLWKRKPLIDGQQLDPSSFQFKVIDRGNGAARCSMYGKAAAVANHLQCREPTSPPTPSNASASPPSLTIFRTWCSHPASE